MSERHLIAEARLLRGAAGDDQAVIEVLLTCKASLERRFGKAFALVHEAAGGLVDPRRYLRARRVA